MKAMRVLLIVGLVTGALTCAAAQSRPVSPCDAHTNAGVWVNTSDGNVHVGEWMCPGAGGWRHATKADVDKFYKDEKVGEANIRRMRYLCLYAREKMKKRDRDGCAQLEAQDASQERAQ